MTSIEFRTTHVALVMLVVVGLRKMLTRLNIVKHYGSQLLKMFPFQHD